MDGMQLLDCITTLRAYELGGLPGIDALKRSWASINMYFGDEVFAAACERVFGGPPYMSAMYCTWGEDGLCFHPMSQIFYQDSEDSIVEFSKVVRAHQAEEERGRAAYAH